MLIELIRFALHNRFLILAGTLLMAAVGIHAAQQLPIDAVPDMTNTQVAVMTEAGSLSPVEVERYVTQPVELAMSGLPDLEELRSISKFGISVVTIVFQEGTDIYRARQLVAERLTSAADGIADGYGPPEMGPLTTALGEILQFEVRGDPAHPEHTPISLRTLLEWDIAPRMREIQGVTEINTHGGYYQTFEVRPRPDLMNSQNVTFADLFAALENNNASAGGGYVVRHDEQRFVRGQALISGTRDIEEIVIRRQPEGAPLLVRDIADVAVAPMTRQGLVTRDERGEIVTGMVMMLVGENSREVVGRVKERLDEITRTLPDGVTIEILYDRSALISRTLKTVVTNLIEGGVLVILVLLVMLGSLRAGLITALAIPLSMLFATSLMQFFGVTASLMSLGAIDFGLIVDSSVIMVENCMHRLSHGLHGRTREQVILDAAIEVRKPTLFGELIIAIVYLPILLLQGTEGKLFRPMALTVLFALAGSLILSMTFMPAMASLALPKKISGEDVLLVRWIKRLYAPIVTRAISAPRLTALLALLVVAAGIPVALRLGAEFMPRLEEGDLLVEANRLPSASLEGAVELSRSIEQELRQFPEVATVFCKTGRPEIANDVMGVQQTDVWIMLKEKDDWRPGMTREVLVDQMSVVLNSRIPGCSFAITQPIEMRVDELVAGVKADVAVLIYGDDLPELAHLSAEVERTLRAIPGAADVKADYQSNLTTITITPRRPALARYGISARQVMDVVESMGGRTVGTVYEGRARFPILVRVPELWRTELDRMKQLPVAEAGGKPVPLHELADIRVEETPPGVEHDGNRRRTFVSANVRGRDVATFVNAARSAVEESVVLPAGYEIRWGGDFENLQSATRRLIIITPIALLLIGMLLHASLGSARMALLIFLAIPVAATGGIFALSLRGMPFSISAGVGFIALSGVAVLNGLVWVSAAEALRRQGVAMGVVTRETALSRLRPVLMTALVAGLGFLPMAISTGDGAEMQRPLATVVIGGLFTSTLLTSLVVPAIYPWFVVAEQRHPPLEPSRSDH
jgi:heavy metal efflux system protein